jgi:hypothetical protein
MEEDWLPNSVNSQPQPLLSVPSAGEMLSGQQPGKVKTNKKKEKEKGDEIRKKTGNQREKK